MKEAQSSTRRLGAFPLNGKLIARCCFAAAESACSIVIRPAWPSFPRPSRTQFWQFQLQLNSIRTWHIMASKSATRFRGIQATKSMARSLTVSALGFAQLFLNSYVSPAPRGSYHVVNLEAIDGGIRLNDDTAVTYEKSWEDR